MMEIVKAEKKDIPLLTEIRLAYLQEDPGFRSEEERNAIAAELPVYYEAHLGRDLFAWLAKDGETAAASAFLLVTEKPASPSFPNGLTGTVLNVFTKKAYRRQGYAAGLMRQLLAEAERMRLSTVELKATEDGVRLYEKLGFRDASGDYLLMKWKSR